jgi:hypothetical protein
VSLVELPPLSDLRVGQLVNLAHSGSHGAYRVTDIQPDGIGCWTYTLEPVTDSTSEDGPCPAG